MTRLHYTYPFVYSLFIGLQECVNSNRWIVTHLYSILLARSCPPPTRDLPRSTLSVLTFPSIQTAFHTCGQSLPPFFPADRVGVLRGLRLPSNEDNLSSLVAILWKKLYKEHFSINCYNGSCTSKFIQNALLFLYFVCFNKKVCL